MIWNPFKTSSQNFLGVDIGTFAVKLAEMSSSGNRNKLENYGEIQAESLYEKPFRTFEKSTLHLSDQDIVRAISAIVEEAGIKTKKAFFSIPDFSSFFTTFTLPPMSKEELPNAIEYESHQHIPLPRQEVTLDWQIIGKKKMAHGPAEFEILLVAVPNEIIHQYHGIAKKSGLELQALEAEVFGLSRALFSSGEDKKPAGIVDIGARSTTMNIVEGGVLKVSHSFDTSGNDFTKMISESLRTGYREAENLKKEYGLNSSESTDLKKPLLPLVDLIISEIKKIVKEYAGTSKKEVEELVVAGGSALMPGLVEYLSEELKMNVKIANPFSSVYYPPVLEQTLQEMGPSYAIAVGTALRGIITS